MAYIIRLYPFFSTGTSEHIDVIQLHSLDSAKQVANRLHRSFNLFHYIDVIDTDKELPKACCYSLHYTPFDLERKIKKSLDELKNDDDYLTIVYHEY